MKYLLFFLYLLLIFPKEALSLSAEYQEIVERNLFSQNRQYEPFEKKEAKGGTFNEEEIKRGVILQGIYRAGDKVWILLDIKPHLRKKWGIEEEKKYFQLGEKLGPCKITKVEKGKIILDKSCHELVLSFKDSPERKRPVPRRVFPSRPPSPGPQTKPKKSQQKPKNPFKVFFKKN